MRVNGQAEVVHTCRHTSTYRGQHQFLRQAAARPWKRMSLEHPRMLSQEPQWVREGVLSNRCSRPSLRLLAATYPHVLALPPDSVCGNP